MHFHKIHHLSNQATTMHKTLPTKPLLHFSTRRPLFPFINSIYNQILRVKMVKLPGFVKMFRASVDKETLKLPSRFIRSIEGSWPVNVALRDRYNNLWQVKVETSGSYCYFQDGWTKFVDDNVIETGDLIVFEYFYQGIFDFKVHNISGCLMEGVRGVKTQKLEELSVKVEPTDGDNDVVGHGNHNDYNPTTADENRRDDHAQVEQVMAAQELDRKETQEKDKKRKGQVKDGGSSSSTKKSKRDYDWYGVELFSSGLVQQPNNPYFVTKIRKDRARELFVPMEVIKAYGLELPDAITLIDPKQRKYQATRKTWADGRMFYVGGWRHLCGLNFVGDDDTLVCEFLNTESDLCIHVSSIVEGQQ